MQLHHFPFNAILTLQFSYMAGRIICYTLVATPTDVHFLEGLDDKYASSPEMIWFKEPWHARMEIGTPEGAAGLVGGWMKS